MMLFWTAIINIMKDDLFVSPLAGKQDLWLLFNLFWKWTHLITHWWKMICAVRKNHLQFVCCNMQKDKSFSHKHFRVTFQKNFSWLWIYALLFAVSIFFFYEWRKDALNWLTITVKTFLILQNVIVKFLFTREWWGKCIIVSTKLLSSTSLLIWNIIPNHLSETLLAVFLSGANNRAPL